MRSLIAALTVFALGTLAVLAVAVTHAEALLSFTEVRDA